MFRVYVTRKIPQEGLSLLQSHADVTVWQGELPPPRDVIVDNIRDIDGLLCLLTDKIDQEVLDVARKLKVIGNYAVGFDNIDIAEATKRGIAVTNTPGVLTETTADLAFGLLMAAARNIVQGDRYVREGLWQTWEPMLLLGRDIHESTLGIIGMGRIGQAMAKRASGFGMRILYYDSAPIEEVDKKYGAQNVSLEQLLQESDFVTIHVPYTLATDKLISTRELNMMKKEAILINTARGPVVDEPALVDALQKGVIAGAGLDVFHTEPISKDHPLCHVANVVVAPHIGSASFRTRAKMATIAASGVIEVLQGRKPYNIVNPEVLRNY
ncbi:glyoxylate reductase [Clostridiales bacterium PH28_bin88]|nr:glyoxylate reductase [Clostridiales bacterium PH28_bin88]